MPSALAVVALIALVGTASAGVAVFALDAQTNLVTVSGKVTAVDVNPHFNATVEFSLASGNTTYEVSAGPPWYWAEQSYPLVKVNDTVKVQGTVNGTEIDAWTVWVNGGPALMLRTGPMPNWAIERSGQTPKTPTGNKTNESS